MISLFQNILQDKLSFTKSKRILKWDEDLSTSYSVSKWCTALKVIYGSIHCVQHWELVQNVARRWHLTLVQPRCPLCWRGCGQIGNLLYIFGSCRCITSLWTKIFQLISKVPVIPPNPALDILNLDIDKVPTQFHTITTHVFTCSQAYDRQTLEIPIHSQLYIIPMSVHSPYGMIGQRLLTRFGSLGPVKLISTRNCTTSFTIHCLFHLLSLSNTAPATC